MPTGRTFSLTHERWLSVRGLAGEREEVGILDAFANAHRFSGLSGDIPTQNVALTRLLLAVIHGSLGPRDLDAWRELWRAPELPVEPIAAYLARYADRFDLLHPVTPFFQVAGLRTSKDEHSDLSKLVADVPNGVRFFSTRRGEHLALTHAEAARWLVHCQAFDPSGIKSGAVGDDRVKRGKGYPIGVAWSGWLGGLLLEGDTLRETLLLNLLPRDHEPYGRDPAVDVPAWERDPSTAAEAGLVGRPTGPVDLYTWQARRIRLVEADERIVGVLICNGDPLSPQNRHGIEPHTAWRRSEAQEKQLKLPLVYMPRAHDPDRAIWRGLPSLLPAAPARGDVPVAGVLQWLDELVEDEVLDPDHVVRLRATGMIYGSQSSVTDDVVHDSLALRAYLAGRSATESASIVESCVEAADRAVRAVGNLAADLAAAAGGEGGGRRSRVMERLYADLDTPFRDWLRELRADSSSVDVQIDWHRTVRRIVGAAAAELTRRLPPAAWEGRKVRGRLLTAAHAESRFRKDLRAALAYAFVDDSERNAS